MLERTSLVLSLVLFACGGTDGEAIPDPTPPTAARPSMPSPVQVPSSSEPTVQQDGGSDAPATLLDGSTSDASDASNPDSAADAAPPTPRFGVSFAPNTLERIEGPVPAGYAGSNRLTLEGWFYMRSVTEYGTLMAVSSPGGAGVSCSIAGAISYAANKDKITCTARQSLAGGQVWSISKAPINAWFHLAFVFDTAKFTMYLDGVKQGEATPDFAAFAPEASCRLRVGGTGRAINEAFDGVADEARASLTTDYTTDFAPAKHLSPAGAVSLALDEGTGTIVGGGAAALQNGPQWTVVTR